MIHPPERTTRTGTTRPPGRIHHHTPESNMTSFEVRTSKRNQFVEITAEVRRAVREAGLTSGLVVVYCPHTTAAITIQENADPDVVHDVLLWLDQHVPKDLVGFRHAETYRKER